MPPKPGSKNRLSFQEQSSFSSEMASLTSNKNNRKPQSAVISTPKIIYDDDDSSSGTESDNGSMASSNFSFVREPKPKKSSSKEQYGPLVAPIVIVDKSRSNSSANVTGIINNNEETISNNGNNINKSSPAQDCNEDSVSEKIKEDEIKNSSPTATLNSTDRSNTRANKFQSMIFFSSQSDGLEVPASSKPRPTSEIILPSATNGLAQLNNNNNKNIVVSAAAAPFIAPAQEPEPKPEEKVNVDLQQAIAPPPIVIAPDVIPIAKLMDQYAQKLYISGFVYMRKMDAMNLDAPWDKYWYEMWGATLYLWKVSKEVASMAYNPSITVEKIIAFETNPSFTILNRIKTEQPEPLRVSLSHSTAELVPYTFDFKSRKPLPPIPYTSLVVVSFSDASFCYLAFHSAFQANGWVASQRLSHFEWSSLTHLYTLSVMKRPIHQDVWDAFKIPNFDTISHEVNIRYENTVKVRFNYASDWAEYIVVVTNNPLSNEEEKADNRSSSFAEKLFKRKSNLPDSGIKSLRLQEDLKKGQVLFFASQKEIKRNTPSFYIPMVHALNMLMFERENDEFIIKVEGNIQSTRHHERLVKKKKSKENLKETKEIVEMNPVHIDLKYGKVDSLKDFVSYSNPDRPELHHALIKFVDIKKVIKFLVATMSSFNIPFDYELKKYILDDEFPGKMEMVEIPSESYQQIGKSISEKSSKLSYQSSHGNSEISLAKSVNSAASGFSFTPSANSVIEEQEEEEERPESISNSIDGQPLPVPSDIEVKAITIETSDAKSERVSIVPTEESVQTPRASTQNTLELEVEIDKSSFTESILSSEVFSPTSEKISYSESPTAPTADSLSKNKDDKMLTKAESVASSQISARPQLKNSLWGSLLLSSYEVAGVSMVPIVPENEDENLIPDIVKIKMQYEHILAMKVHALFNNKLAEWSLYCKKANASRKLQEIYEVDIKSRELVGWVTEIMYYVDEQEAEEGFLATVKPSEEEYSDRSDFSEGEGGDDDDEGSSIGESNEKKSPTNSVKDKTNPLLSKSKKLITPYIPSKLIQVELPFIDNSTGHWVRHRRVLDYDQYEKYFADMDMIEVFKDFLKFPVLTIYTKFKCMTTGLIQTGEKKNDEEKHGCSSSSPSSSSEEDSDEDDEKSSITEHSKKSPHSSTNAEKDKEEEQGDDDSDDNLPRLIYENQVDPSVILSIPLLMQGLFPNLKDLPLISNGQESEIEEAENVAFEDSEGEYSEEGSDSGPLIDLPYQVKLNQKRVKKQRQSAYAIGTNFRGHIPSDSDDEELDEDEMDNGQEDYEMYGQNTLLGKLQVEQEMRQKTQPEAIAGPLLGHVKIVDKDKKFSSGLLGQVKRREQERDQLKKMGIYSSIAPPNMLGAYGMNPYAMNPYMMQYYASIGYPPQGMMPGAMGQQAGMPPRPFGFPYGMMSGMMVPTNFDGEDYQTVMQREILKMKFLEQERLKELQKAQERELRGGNPDDDDDFESSSDDDDDDFSENSSTETSDSGTASDPEEEKLMKASQQGKKQMNRRAMKAKNAQDDSESGTESSEGEQVIKGKGLVLKQKRRTRYKNSSSESSENDLDEEEEDDDEEEEESDDDVRPISSPSRPGHRNNMNPGSPSAPIQHRLSMMSIQNGAPSMYPSMPMHIYPMGSSPYGYPPMPFSNPQAAAGSPAMFGYPSQIPPHLQQQQQMAGYPGGMMNNNMMFPTLNTQVGNNKNNNANTGGIRAMSVSPTRKNQSKEEERERRLSSRHNARKSRYLQESSSEDSDDSSSANMKQHTKLKIKAINGNPTVNTKSKTPTTTTSATQPRSPTNKVATIERNGIAVQDDPELSRVRAKPKPVKKPVPRQVGKKKPNSSLIQQQAQKGLSPVESISSEESFESTSDDDDDSEDSSPVFVPKKKGVLKKKMNSSIV